tara:strand:- start:307 stop:459 length:153 start_codon:yes stop_codon:yes gene_type:complete
MFDVLMTFIVIATIKGNIKNTAIVKPIVLVTPNLLIAFLIVYILKVKNLF